MVDMGYPLSVASTSLLFFFRIRAVFSHNNYVIFFFFCLWLTVVGGCLVVPFAVTTSNIGPTAYCINTKLASFSSAAGITAVVHDTAVLLAISYRLLQNSCIDYNGYAMGDRLKLIFSGKNLPRFSKSIFQDGQLYYL